MAAKQAVREQALPFEVTMNVPNAETIEAFKEVEKIKENPPAYKSYNSFSELLAEVNGDV